MKDRIACEPYLRRPTKFGIGSGPGRLDDVEESPETRERIGDFARARLAEPAGDAVLAEILAAEADY